MATHLETLQAVTQNQHVVRFVAGLFERMGIVILDTGEEFTCHHRGDRLDFENQLSRDRVDYTVEVQAAQAERLASEARRGDLDAAEKFRVVRTLFTPATAALLTDQPVLSHPWVRRLSGAEDLIHVRLRSPVDSEPDAAHTLAYAARQWIVIPGLHGKARRTFTLDTEQALDYQRRAFAAAKANSFGGWISFGLWYRQWRSQVSRPGGGDESR